MVRTTMHKVECYGKRVYIAVVRVIDKRYATASFVHLKTHSYRLQQWHTLSDLHCCES